MDKVSVNRPLFLVKGRYAHYKKRRDNYMSEFKIIKDETKRILVKGHEISNDQFETGLNNHDLVIGASCAGKTGCYVASNLLVASNSMVVVDTKGTLFGRYSDYLKKKGFKVRKMDFIHPESSESYNILGFVRKSRYGAGYNQKDLKTIANMLIPDGMDEEKIWPEGARLLLISIMAYVLEMLVPEDHNMRSVVKIYQRMAPEFSNKANEVSFFEDLRAENPESFAVSMYDMFRANAGADKMMASFSMFVGNALEPFVYDDLSDLFCGKEQIRFEDLGREKTILFVNVSDVDRSMDNVVGIFYQQMINALVDEADSHPDGRLKVPVRIIMDDFASNFVIPDFDKLITVLRSRQIYVSILLQDYNQLETMYLPSQAKTIFNNCDCKIFIGSQGRDTALFVADMVGCVPETIMRLKGDQAMLVVKGRELVVAENIHPYEMDREFGL